jgi:hypothetical protein
MNPKIRLIGRYGDYRVGAILTPPASLRKILFDRKVAVYEPEAPRAQEPVLVTVKKPKSKKRK